MKQSIKLKVNGQIQEVFVEPWRSLAEVLRDDLGLTGTKVGCNEGSCGSCTVLIDGSAVRSCLMLAHQAKGKEIVTIEGLGGDTGLHPLQQAFIEHYAVQCGFCTPGMILSAKALLDENPDPAEEEIRKALAGNLCRCTGYFKIIESILAAKEKMTQTRSVSDREIGMGISEVGQSGIRVDALEKVTGRAIYCDDIKLSGTLHTKVLRSPYSHAKILSIETSKAEKIPGVKCVITHRDLPQVRFGFMIADRYILARNTVRYVGDPVAAVAAETVDIAEEALELIKVEYEKLPAIFDVEEAMGVDTPVIIHPDLKNYKKRVPVGIGPDPLRPNLFARSKVLKGDVEKGFKESDLVMENRFSTGKMQHCPLEPHVAIARPEADGGLTIWVGRQNIWKMRDTVASLFGLNQSKIRVIQSYVGGGFGQKNRVILEPIVIALALKTKRPVKLNFTREEVFLSGSKVPMIIYVKDGVKRDGKLVAREMRAILKAGPYDHNVSMVTRNCSFGAMGTYQVPNFKFESFGVYTNEPPGCGFRGFGNNQTVFAVESQMDMLAERLGIDPIEMRRINLLKEGEPNAYGEITHSIGAEQCLDRVTEFIELNEKPLDEGSWLKGKGIALGNKYSAAPSVSLAKIRLSEDGSITVCHGADELGQGCNTIAAQIAATEFCVPINKVKVIFTDTLVTPFFGGGSTSSRVTYNLGNAMILACRDAKKKLFDLAADKLGVSPSEIETREGEVYLIKTPSKRMTISQLLMGYKVAHPAGFEVSNNRGEIVGEDTYIQEDTPEDPETRQIDPWAASQGKRLNAFFSHMAKAAEVAVNVKTGQVKVLKCSMAIDALPINPKMCEQQMDGGMGMAIGETLYEEIRMDKGKIMNPNFTDYSIPTVMDLPLLHGNMRIIVPTPHKDGPFGAKGFSEGAMIGLQPAITNAIYNAVGVRIKDLPITPERVLQALKKRAIKGTHEGADLWVRGYLFYPEKDLDWWKR